MHIEIADMRKSLCVKIRDFYSDNRIFLGIWLLYGVVLAIVYSILPISFESNWLYFYRYLFENNAVPYIDSRVGYPPLGFLTYMPLAYLAGLNLQPFVYGLRALNACFLLLSQLLAYVIIRKVRGKREALISMIAFFALPSITQLSRFSNDLLALFATLLALHFILEKRVKAAGVAIASAALIKGYPALMIFPALIWLKTYERRYKLFGAAFLTTLAVSLPFLVGDPFMYLSTFTHHGERGPWESAWALIDGWYGHGGFIHPDFDQFLYQSQLRKIYPLLPNDHAFYSWRYPALPLILMALQVVAVAIPVVLMRKKRREEDLLHGVALALLGYLLFFKGYSPQFTVLTLPLILVTVGGLMKVGLCLLLEAATELEFIAWLNIMGISNDLHLPMLEAAIVIRTAVLTSTWVLLIFQLSRRGGRR